MEEVSATGPPPITDRRRLGLIVDASGTEGPAADRCGLSSPIRSKTGLIPSIMLAVEPISAFLNLIPVDFSDFARIQGR